MPSVSSKELHDQKQELHKKEVARTIRMVGPLVFMIVTGGQLLNQSRSQLVSNAFQGDQSRAASMLAKFGGIAGATEFLLNPVIGRLSDRFGRRPLLLISPVVCALLRGLVFALPGAPRAIMLERVLSAAVITGFFSTMRAMLNDKLSGADRVFADAQMAVYAGAGSIFGPLAEGFILSKFGARGNYGLVAAINICIAAIMFNVADETLQVSDQKPLTLRGCSPLTFIEMFRVSSVNQRLMFILLFQCWGEGRINQDINTLYMRNHLNWTAAEVSSFLSMCGLTVILGGKTVKTSIQKLGLRGHTTMSNLALAMAFFVQGTRSKYFSQYAALAFSVLGARKHDAVASACIDLTLANTDMGKGQVSAGIANFKSMAAIFGPPIAGRAYTYGQANGMPGLPFRIISGFYLLAEAFHLSMSDEQLEVKSQ